MSFMEKTQIILVDDDPVILKLQVKVVKKTLGVLPQYFLNGAGALDFMKSVYSEEFRFLILLDINMPGMSGWDVLDEIKKLPFRDKIRVALVTSSVDDYDKRKAAEYSTVVDFIEKPFRPNAIDRLRQSPALGAFLGALFANLFIFHKTL